MTKKKPLTPVMLVFDTATHNFQNHMSDRTPLIVCISALSFKDDFDAPSQITFVLRFKLHASHATAH